MTTDRTQSARSAAPTTDRSAAPSQRAGTGDAFAALLDAHATPTRESAARGPQRDGEPTPARRDDVPQGRDSDLHATPERPAGAPAPTDPQTLAPPAATPEPEAAPVVAPALVLAELPVPPLALAVAVEAAKTAPAAAPAPAAPAPATSAQIPGAPAQPQAPAAPAVPDAAPASPPAAEAPAPTAQPADDAPAPASAPRVVAPQAPAAKRTAVAAEPVHEPATPAPSAPAKPVAAAPAPAEAPASAATVNPVVNQPAAPVAAQAAPHRSVALHHAPAAAATLLHVAHDRGITHAKLALKPAELGGVEIRLQSTAAGVTAQVVADSPEAARMLAQHGDELRRALEARDVNLLSLEVSTSADQQHQGTRGEWMDGDDAGTFGASGRSATGDAEPAAPVTHSVIELPGGLLVDVLA